MTNEEKYGLYRNRIYDYEQKLGFENSLSGKIGKARDNNEVGYTMIRRNTGLSEVAVANLQIRV